MVPSPIPPGYAVRYYEAVGSTNDEAKTAAREGAVDGSVFWSGHQSAGRGTHGREWHTQPGNLAVSIVKRPRIPISFASQGALVTAVALASALPELGVASVRIRLKWPNDVLVDGAKISGILLEGEAEGPATRWLVVGTGLNLAHHPSDTRHPATNLAALGLKVPAEVALCAYLAAFDLWWSRWRRYDFQIIATAWAARTLHKPGDLLRITQGRELLEVTYYGLAPDGALVVRGADGLEKRIVSGEIFA
jgi:BirA family transcriptional regulator, biotin operon repressor / biotin---[acetyl-CoA-carboxylase] ligase